MWRATSCKIIHKVLHQKGLSVLWAKSARSVLTEWYCRHYWPAFQEKENPHSDIESFDIIYKAALQVVIVASANGVGHLFFVLYQFWLKYSQWSPIMYDMIDAEFFVSCFFFIICVIVLNFWLINLFVAVITNTFSAIRKDTSKSAFGAAPWASFHIKASHVFWLYAVWVRC